MFRQSRTVCCIFYNIDDLNLFIDKFGFADFNYAYIYHDKDEKEDGTPKPPHYHFYGYRKSPITEMTLKNFAVTCKENIFFENLKSNEQALLNYFLHVDCEDKFHYDKKDIIANFDIESKLQGSGFRDQIDPATIISMFDNGLRVTDIIRRYPKLIYSIASLQRYEKLLYREKYQTLYPKPKEQLNFNMHPIKDNLDGIF